MLTSTSRSTPEVCGRRNSIPVPRTPVRSGLALRVFTKCVEAAIAPLRQQGLRLFNYSDDWLLCARSRAAAVQDCHLVVAHLFRLGFVINKEKSVLRPGQTAHFLGMSLDSTSM